MSEREVGIKQRSATHEGGQRMAKVTFIAVISEGGKAVEIKVRISYGKLDGGQSPEEIIREHFSGQPLPKPNEVVDIPA